MYRCKVSLLINQLNNKVTDKDTTTFRAQIMDITYFDSKTINYLGEKLNINFEQYLKREKPYLSSKQIKNLHQEGFDIGSHSVDHPWFRDIDYPEQEQQITQSLTTLRNLVPLVNSFSFPFSDDGITTSLLDFIYNQNIALTFACAGVKQDETLKHIQRLAMEIEQPAKQHLTKTASQILPKAFLKYLVKKFIHTHKVGRPSLI